MILTAATPQALEAKVSFDPTAHTFEACGTWTFDSAGPAPYVLASGVTAKLDAEPAPEGVLVPEDRRVAFRAWGSADRPGENFVGPDAVLLNGVTFQFYPRFEGSVDTVVRVEAPEGWIVRATGDAEGDGFRAPTTRWFLVAGRKNGHELRRGDLGVVVAEEATAGPFLDALERITTELEGWYGRRPSRTLTVVEVPFDGGFSGIGLIVVHGGAVRSFLEGDREGAFLAHEIAHQWFGGVLDSTNAIREGLATYTALRYERARSAERGELYRERLLEMASRARPGRTIREITRADGWRDYEAVAYARSALVFDRVREQIGDDRFHALLRRWVSTASVTQAMSFDEFLAPLDEIAPELDVDPFVARTVDADWDPRTNEVRREVTTISGKIAALLVALTFLFARRFAPVEGLAAAGVALWMVRLPWVIAWPVVAGIALVLGGTYLLPDGYRGWAVIGYFVAASAFFAF